MADAHRANLPEPGVGEEKDVLAALHAILTISHCKPVCGMRQLLARASDEVNGPGKHPVTLQMLRDS